LHHYFSVSLSLHSTTYIPGKAHTQTKQEYKIYLLMETLVQTLTRALQDMEKIWMAMKPSEDYEDFVRLLINSKPVISVILVI